MIAGHGTRLHAGAEWLDISGGVLTADVRSDGWRLAGAKPRGGRAGIFGGRGGKQDMLLAEEQQDSLGLPAAQQAPARAGGDHTSSALARPLFNALLLCTIAALHIGMLCEGSFRPSCSQQTVGWVVKSLHRKYKLAGNVKSGFVLCRRRGVHVSAVCAAGRGRVCDPGGGVCSWQHLNIRSRPA